MQEFRIKEFRCKYYVSEICIVLYEFLFCIDFILVQPNKKHFLYHRYNFLIFMHELQLPYSREQKHVSISDTPMLLIEINSISNMGCQK